MRIENSTVTMFSSRKSRKDTECTQTVTSRRSGAGAQETTVTVREARSSETERSASAALYQTGSGGVTLQEAREEREDAQSASGRSGGTEAVRPSGGQSAQVQAPPEQRDWFGEITSRLSSDPRVQIYRRLLELLDRVTGHKGPLKGWELFEGDPQENRGQNPFRLSASAAAARYRQNMSFFGVQLSAPGAAAPADLSLAAKPVNGLWLRKVQESGFVCGVENTSFSSSGTAVTAGGRTLNFSISVEMSRSFMEAYEVTGKTEIYTDPLVINLDTHDAALSDLHFFFDLDGDGEKETLSGLDSASGFLALDRNGDGEINDGSELFGAKTGDGFKELAQYDQDGNGWIDEGDEVFRKLSVWVQCGGGQAKLLSLTEANVGAIFLGSRETQFSLTNSSGDVGAMARRTGIYLKESGEAGTVQHLDFKDLYS